MLALPRRVDVSNQVAMLLKKAPFQIILQLLFYATLAVYSYQLLADPHFNPIDDYQFLETTQVGKFLPPFIVPDISRFCPLLGFEYNVITRLLPATPVFYFAYHLLQLLIFSFLSLQILKRATRNVALQYAILLLYITTPGFITALFRPFVGERSVIFWFTIFLFFYFKFQDKNKILSFGTALLCASIALYYKEPVFLMLGSFALLHLVSSWKTSALAAKWLDGSLLISAGIYGLLYFVFVYLQRGPLNYAATIHNQDLIQQVISFFQSDPLLFLFLLPLLVIRVVAITTRRAQFHSFYDSLLLAALIYILVYFKLAIAGQYYLQPAYIAIMPALAYNFKPGCENQVQKVQFSYAVIALVFVLMSNPTQIFPKSLPSTLNKYKYVASNYDPMLNYLVQDVRSRAKGKRVNIFLNLNKNSGYEAYWSFIKFLQYKGLTSRQFDVKTDQPENDFYKFNITDPYSPYSVLKSNQPNKIARGDYLVVLPLLQYNYVEPTYERLDAQHKNSYDDTECLHTIDGHYRPLFRTNNQLGPPVKAARGMLCRFEPNYYVFEYQ